MIYHLGVPLTGRVLTGFAIAPVLRTVGLSAAALQPAHAIN